MGRDLTPLPLHFLSRCELGREEELLKQWLDVGLTESGRFILMLGSVVVHLKMNTVKAGNFITFFALSKFQKYLQVQVIPNFFFSVEN